MIEDAALELTSTPGLGESFTDDDYGGQPYDLGTAGVDPAIGEPLVAMYQVMEDGASFTDLTISVVNDTNGAGGSEVELVTTGAVAAASLTEAIGAQVIGVIKPAAIALQYLSAKLAFSDAGTIKVRVWLQKGRHAIPVNAGAI
jgi:hypothetical protein